MKLKKWHEVTFLFIIILCTFLIFSNSLQNEFINWDDNKQITENPFIKTLDSSTFLHLYSYDKHTSFSLLTFAFNYYYGKLDPFGYHLINIFLHLINILLVYLLVLKISHNKLISFIAIILFAWHPMRVESVVWISERKDLLFALFSLLSLLLYIRYLKRYSILWFIPVLILTWLASISKIQSVVLPLLFVIIDIKFNRKLNVSLIFEKIVLFYTIFVFDVINSPSVLVQGLTFLFLLITIVYIYKAEANKFNKYIVLFISILCILISLCFQLTSIYLPLMTLLIYLIFLKDLPIHKEILLRFKKPLLFLIISIFACFLMYYFTILHPLKYWSYNNVNENSFSIINRVFIACYSLFFYLFKFILPVNLNAINPYPIMNNGLLPIVYYIYTSLITVIVCVIIRKIYKEKKIMTNYIFWGLFFIINISVVLHIIPIKGRLVVADRYSYFAYIGLFVITGYLFEYLNRTRFFAPILKYLFILVCIILASLTYNRNKVWKDNFTLYNDVIKKNPTIYFAYWNLGTSFLEMQNYSKGIENLNTALNLKPDIIDKSNILASRGWAKYTYNDTTGAVKDLLESIKLNRNNTVAHNNLGWIYFGQKQLLKANREFSEAIYSDSTYFMAWVNRGILKNETKNFKEAISDFNKVIELNPEYFYAYNNIGWAKFNLKQFDEAIVWYTKAINLNQNLELGYYNRAFAKMELKDFNGAVSDFEISIKLNPERVYNYYYCGWAYYNLNELKSACNYWSYSSEKGCLEAKKTILDYCK